MLEIQNKLHVCNKTEFLHAIDHLLTRVQKQPWLQSSQFTAAAPLYPSPNNAVTIVLAGEIFAGGRGGGLGEDDGKASLPCLVREGGKTLS
jgi:hypothetical protein